MTAITLKGNPIQTSGSLPSVGSKAPDFTLVGTDLKEVSLADSHGKTRILNVFPSVDTDVCAQSVRTFNERAASGEGTLVLNIPADLPFALKRFCAAEGIDNAIQLSTFRGDFARTYGLRIEDGPLAGLCARAVLVVDGDGKVTHAELVPEIAQEPNYDAALAAAGR